jgi:hypothetical protein
MKPLIALALLLACLFHMPHAWAQCAPGIPEAGNPECLPPDDPNSPYYQSSNGQSNGHMPPPRPVVRWADRWGAIVIDNNNGRAGNSTNYSSKSEAVNAAMNDCIAHGGQQCKVQLAYYNQCAAIAWGDTSYITYGGPTKENAELLALHSCGKATTNCKIVYTACSLPARVQ